MKNDLGKKLTDWVSAYKDVVGRNALAETPSESADYLLTLITQAGYKSPEQLKAEGWKLPEDVSALMNGSFFRGRESTKGIGDNIAHT